MIPVTLSKYRVLFTSTWVFKANFSTYAGVSVIAICAWYSRSISSRCSGVIVTLDLPPMCIGFGFFLIGIKLFLFFFFCTPRGAMRLVRSRFTIYAIFGDQALCLKHTLVHLVSHCLR
uniref:Uncharacterized protein n=1 Tax=Babesia bovis TaxID=5865 RepID=S6B9T6_BABBO|nr:hypothetical protein [Babesia bovis]